MEQKSDRIKTAWERALERMEKLEISEDKVKELEYLPEGAKLAAQFLKEDKLDLAASLSKYDAKVRKFVLKGLESTLLSNIHLPQNERAREENKKALAGISQLKKSKSRINQISDALEQLFNQYEQARRQLYGQFRAQFEGALRQALQQQQPGIAARANINVEAPPEFQQRWLETCGRLDAQYEQALNQVKQELAKIT